MELTQDDVIRIFKLIDESPMGRVSLGAAAVPEAAEAAGIEPGMQGSAPPEESPGADGHLLAVKAPLLGIFYRRSQPGVPPYVEEGSPVEEDTTVALIEVMKLFNPVKAGVKGRIARICVENNALVEYE